jgi:Mg2+ and Co2+ transporter CorA
MFDTDKDGRLSFESLRKVLEFHAAGSVSTPSPLSSPTSSTLLLNEKSFQELVNHLDSDGSGDISFSEFSEGIRLLMLRALFQHPGGPRHDGAKLELIDYNVTRLERRIVGNDSAASIRHAKSATSSPFFASSKHMSSTDFYFSPRPEWVMTRWINVACSSKAASILTMKRLAIKHLLHPLALEDALSSETHRPKVEVFSSHYFLMIPIFSIKPPPLRLTDGTSGLDSPTNLLSKVARLLRRCCYGCRERFRRSLSPGTSDKAGTLDVQQSYGPPPLSQVRIQMLSIFVNVPTNDTIITFMTGAEDSSSDDNDAYGPVPWQLRVQKELEKSYSKLRQYDAQYLVYALLDQAVDLVVPLVSAFREEIDHQRTWLQQHHYRELQNIHSIQRGLEKVGRKLKPFLRLLTHVIEDDAISPGATVYLRDVLDNLECVDDELKVLLVECQALDTDAGKFQSRQMDRTLYTLTVVSAVFLPAQFLTGVWGMNFVEMPELDESWGVSR